MESGPGETDVNARIGSIQNTPLILACKKGDHAEVLALLEKGANVNLSNKQEDTALYFACFFGHHEIVKLLLKHNADPYKSNKSGKTPISLASNGIYPELLKTMMDAGVDINARNAKNNNTPLIDACQAGELAPAQSLLAAGADANLLNKEGQTALLIVCNKGWSEIAELLLANGANPNIADNEGRAPLSIAADNRNYELVKLLIERGAEIQSDAMESLLFHAINHGQRDIVKLLLTKKADPFHANKVGLTPIKSALDSGQNEILLLLLEEALNRLVGRDINLTVLENNQTLLHLACKCGNLALCEKLLANGANPFIKDMWGKLPFEIALQNRHKTIAERLQAIAPTPEQLLDAKQHAVAATYRNSIENMSKMIILGLETERPPEMNLPTMRCITNNEGYNVNPSRANGIITGQPLTFTYQNKIYPIGYNIFIPEGTTQVNNVIIDVYGGFTKKDSPNSPDETGSIAALLAEHGCPVISLNLPDLLQDKSQVQMTEELHAIIHGCINHFFETISESPQSLDLNLAQMRFADAHYYLYGASFGGRTALRHGQLFPGTFKGYISHDGALAPSQDMRIASSDDRPFTNDGLLSPIYHVQDMQEPVLIFQNRDDNNVNIQTALKFYHELQTQGKSDLARLCFFEKGNPVRARFQEVNKGHGITSDRDRYVDAILALMEHGPSQIPELHQHAYLMQERVAKQFFRQEDDKERFLALASETFFKNKEHQQSFRQDAAAWDKVWQKDYKPLLHTLVEIKKLANDPEYYQQQMDILVNQGLLTDEVIKNAIKHHAAAYREYYRETNNFDSISIEEICNNPYIIEEFRTNLTSFNSRSSYDFKCFMLESLYLGNSGLLAPNETLEAAEREYKAAFESKVKESSLAVRKSWLALKDVTFNKREQTLKEVMAQLPKIDFSNYAAVFQLIVNSKELILIDDNVSIKAKLALTAIIKNLDTNLRAMMDKQYPKDDMILALARKSLIKTHQEISDEELDKIYVYVNAHSDKADPMLLPMLLLQVARLNVNSNNYHKLIKLNGCIEKSMPDEKIRSEIQKKSIALVQQYQPKLSSQEIKNMIDNLSPSDTPHTKLD